MTFVECYLSLGLALGRHLNGFVDAYYGPAAFAEQAAAGPPADPARLAAEAARLLDELDQEGFAEQRTRWFAAQLAALEMVARRLTGERIGYRDEVERCYGVRLAWTDEDVFAAAHRTLDDVLPGSGPVGERYEAWQEARLVPGAAVVELLDALTREARARTPTLIELPAGEQVELGAVANEPWNAFNYYLGGLRSRVVVNTDLPLRASRALTIVTHECYPGHHTERVLKEAGLVRARGQVEETLVLTGAPQALVSEGIAEIAGDVLLGDDEDRLLAGYIGWLGIHYEPEIAAAVRRAFGELRSVSTNAALLLHERGASRQDALDYEVRWGLRTPERAAKSLEFLTDPTWRAYQACYSEGRRLASSFVAGDLARFRRLLTEQLIPADLALVP